MSDEESPPAESEEEAGGAAEAECEAEEERERALVFVDPELSQEDADGIGEALGVKTSRVDDSELLAGDADALDAALAVVVAWDLAGQTALDLVESLCRTERAVEVPVVVASAEPTRGRVMAALRAGATSFARRPYDVEELRARLGPQLEPSNDPEEISP